jgi:hypothetical protein
MPRFIGAFFFQTHAKLSGLHAGVVRMAGVDSVIDAPRPRATHHQFKRDGEHE